MAYTKIKTTVLIGAIALGLEGTTTITLTRTMAAAEEAPKPHPGYATPEAANRSLILALQKGDKKMFLAACTPEEAERFRKRMEGISDEEFAKEAAELVKAFSKFEITKKEAVSETEVHLHVKALAADENTSPEEASTVVKMKRIGTEWKYDGQRRDK